MTSSDPNKRAEDLVVRLLHMLDESELSKRIDDPIEAAVSSFSIPETSDISHGVFNASIADFVQHVYRHGLRLKQDLTETQALSKAVAILDRNYRNQQSSGYNGAFVDAWAAGAKGIAATLAFIAEVVKYKERMAYVRWVYVSLVDDRDSELKRGIAAALLKRGGVDSGIPVDMQADEYRLLVEHYLADQRSLAAPFSALLNILGETHEWNRPLFSLGAPIWQPDV